MMEKQKRLQVSYVDPAQLKPNPWNTNVVSPENESKIEESLSRFGAFKPILVRELADGTLEILGGEHRTRAATKLGHKQVPVINLGRITDNEAKEIGLVDNGRYGADDTISLAKLLEELGNKDELATFLPYTSDDLDKIFTSADVDLDSLGIPDEDTSPGAGPAGPAPVATHTTMKYRVRMEDAQFISEKLQRVMKEQGFTKDTAEVNAGDALAYIIKNLP